MGIFLDMFDMIETYEERLIGNDEVNGFVVDTVRVTDTGYYAETAIRHPKLDHGDWVVVEEYIDRETAETGHKTWVEMLGTGKIKKVRSVQDGRTYQIRW